MTGGTQSFPPRRRASGSRQPHPQLLRFPDIECLSAVRGSETRGSLSPSFDSTSAPGPATQGGGRDLGSPATRRGARGGNRNGSDPLVDHGPGGGRSLSGSDRDRRRLWTRTRGHPRPGIGKFHDRTRCSSRVSKWRANRLGPSGRTSSANGTTAALGEMTRPRPGKGGGSITRPDVPRAGRGRVRGSLRGMRPCVESEAG
jgi:hypothetical protein